MIARIRTWLTAAIAVHSANEDARELARAVKSLATLAAIEEARADRAEASVDRWLRECSESSKVIEQQARHIERLTQHVGALARIAKMLNGVRSYDLTTAALRERWGRVRAHRAAMHKAAPCQVPGCEWCQPTGGDA